MSKASDLKIEIYFNNITNLFLTITYTLKIPKLEGSHFNRYFYVLIRL